MCVFIIITIVLFFFFFEILLKINFTITIFFIIEIIKKSFKK